jgi:hypothetical protein
MEDKSLINEVKKIKDREGYTLFELSKRLDVQVPTLQRWLKSEHINRVYAKMVKEKLHIL